MTLFFLEQKNAGGIFNVGSGHARNLGKILRKQFFLLWEKKYILSILICRKNKKTFSVSYLFGYEEDSQFRLHSPVMTLEEGIEDYVKKYLIPGRHLGDFEDQ
ncbi:MAG: hypothetical protein CM1200mP16_06590 [Nitrospina sp.]|nr:MAG: hypothetical protein CM1200mP16_06590 [Nitrospina sp.]